MSCEELRSLSVSDDPAEQRRWRHHAAECAACARLLADDERLLAEVRRWRRETPSPPSSLRNRVRDAALEGSAVDRPPGSRHPRGTDSPAPVSATRSRGPDAGPRQSPPRWWSGPRWLAPGALGAVAAALLIAVGLVVFWPAEPATSTGGQLLLDDALAAAEAAERDHARAIADLEAAASGVLDRADDPRTPAREAALLMSYRHRLRSLDTTIAEIRGYLEDNPGLPGARAVLLAAYRDKTDVLQELLARSKEMDA